MTKNKNKIQKYLFVWLYITVILSSCGWTRIGSLTMISTRNIESKIEYKLVAKNVEGVTKMKHDDQLQNAVDEAVKQYPEGEFLKNTVVFIKNNGRKIKVVGDVWGIPSVEKNITQKVTANINYEVGDKVAFKNSHGKIIEGNIIGINNTSAIVEYINSRNEKNEKDEISFDRLTKLQSISDTPNTAEEKKNEVASDPKENPIARNTLEKEIYKVTVDNLNMRTKPGSVVMLMKINKGASVEVIERTSELWWKIKYNDKIGYVSAKYLSK